MKSIDGKSAVENSGEAMVAAPEVKQQKEISPAEFIDFADNERKNFSEETTSELTNANNAIGLDIASVEAVKKETNVESELADINREAATTIEDSKIKIIGSESKKEIKYSVETHPTLLLFDRVKDPIIQEQIVDLLFLSEQAEAAKEEIEYVSDFDENGVFGKVKDENGNPIVVRKPSSYIPKTKDELRIRLNNTIGRIENDTPISFDENDLTAGSSYEGERELIALNDAYLSKEATSPKQRAFIEAHEKGHVLRPYESLFLREYFSSGFDVSAMHYTESDFEAAKRRQNDPDTASSTFAEMGDEFKSAAIEYLFSAPEVAERMSQLKNYFGMGPQDQFTKEHLEYAKQHYITDTDYDNEMGLFFQAITPQKEEAFVKLVNSSGI